MWGHLRVGESQSPCKATPVYRRNCPRMGGSRGRAGSRDLVLQHQEHEAWGVEGGGGLGFTHLALTRLSSEDAAV